jgi:hypothetical protein
MSFSENARTTLTQRGIILVELLLLAILLVMLVKSPSQLVYDESNTAPTISTFHEYGLTSIYLNSLPHASGPLFGAVYSLFSFFSHDDVYRLRFINYGLTWTFICLLFWLLRREQFPFSKPLAGAVIAIPTIWVCTGIVLDEMLGLVLLTAALAPLGKNVFESIDRPWERALRFLLAGALIGLASLDRQPFVLASIAVPVAPIVCRRQVAYAVLTPLASILLLAPAIITWRGLTPPLVGSHAGLSPDHSIMSFAYGGLFTFLIAPLYLQIRKWQIWFAILILSSLVINVTFGVIIVAPAKGLALKFIPDNIMNIYGLACGTVLLGVSIFYGICAVVRTIECRKEVWKLVSQVGLILLLTWPVIMQVQYSSRYTLMALPFLMLAVKDHYRVNLYTTARTLAGGLMGAAVLWTYYYNP